MMSEDIEPHFERKYEILQKLGTGPYGIVWKAKERKTNSLVAIKKVLGAFHDCPDAQQTFREIMILQELGHEHNPNCLKLLDLVKAENNEDLYLIFEYMDSDLRTVIRAGVLQDVHKVYIIYQILKALLYLHTAEIVHRDLKPSNILIDSECSIKLSDFGSSQSLLPCDEKPAPIAVMMEPVAARWYIAPEIVLGSSRYSKAVDMWSVGCILGELISGKPMFPGQSIVNQIELITEFFGKPDQEDLDQIGGIIDSSIISSMCREQKHTFSTYFKDASPDAISLLKQCLEFNPNKRITVEEALKHPFFAQFRDPETEYRAATPVQILIRDQNKTKIKAFHEAMYTNFIEKRRAKRRLEQVTYLQQLGINVSDDYPISSNIEASASANPQQIQKTPTGSFSKMEAPNQASCSVKFSDAGVNGQEEETQQPEDPHIGNSTTKNGY